jgi:hypothetical protein
VAYLLLRSGHAKTMVRPERIAANKASSSAGILDMPAMPSIGFWIFQSELEQPCMKNLDRSGGYQ